MRIGYKYPIVDKTVENMHLTVDSSVKEFAKTQKYINHASKFSDQESFLANFQNRANKELNEILNKLLKKERTILGIGSGFGEHEIPFYLGGYNITASDIVIEPLRTTQQLFKTFKVRLFDLFHPNLDIPYDDILITGLDFYFDDERAKALFKNAAYVLQNAGNTGVREGKEKRLIFTLRYNDNFATYVIDNLVIPLEAFIKNVIFMLFNYNKRCVKKQHGYRRTRKEIVSLAAVNGFELVSAQHAGYGIELTRSSILIRALSEIPKA